jgi:hypothetical protein
MHPPEILDDEGIMPEEARAMKWPRLRFTVRRLMIAVAILALSIRTITWVGEMRTRSAEYEKRASKFGWMTSHAGSGGTWSNRGWVGIGENENTHRQDEWACKLAEKYWRLSDYPWLPVEPDPPPPARLDHPRSAIDIPDWKPCGCWNRPNEPPAWTFLWTWRRW